MPLSSDSSDSPDAASCLCPSCESERIVRKGVRRNKFQSFQQYQCRSCRRIFRLNPLPNHTYPDADVARALSTYNLGYTLKETKEKLNLKASLPTISNWLKKYGDVTTYQKLRKKGLRVCKPKDVIFKKPLVHKQVYQFQYHKAKILLLEELNPMIPQATFQKLREYLARITTDRFPHHIFSNIPNHPDGKKTSKNDREQRISQLTFDTLPFLRTEKCNQANKSAELALKTAKNNRERHQIIQNFMLINDTTTTAVEVPVYLTGDDIKYFQKRHFTLPMENQPTPVTGHIDILQIRNNLIHILDYKPDAQKTRPVNQLTLYALSLASRLQIPLKQIKTAWFDNKNYYEFFPLHAVYNPGKPV